MKLPQRNMFGWPKGWEVERVKREIFSSSKMNKIISNLEVTNTKTLRTLLDRVGGKIRLSSAGGQYFLQLDLPQNGHVFTSLDVLDAFDQLEVYLKKRIGGMS